MAYVKKFMAARLDEPVRPELINRMFSSIEEEFKLISKGMAGIGKKVAVDAEATPDFLGALSSDGALRVNDPLVCADGGDFITLDLDEALIDHALLGGVLADQHHAQLHASTHHEGGGDQIIHDSLLGGGGNKHIDWTNATSLFKTVATAPDVVDGAIMDITGSILSSTTNPQYGLALSPTVAPPSVSTQDYVAVRCLLASSSSYISGAALYGFQGGAYYVGTGTLGTAYGAYLKNYIATAGIISTSVGLRICDPGISGGGAVTNNYGIYIENIQGGGTVNYSIYSVGGANYLGGSLELGDKLTIGSFYLDALIANNKVPDSNRLNGQLASYYSIDGHIHDDRYYTEGEVDILLAAQDAFLELLDTPASYVGQAGKFLKVNATPDGLEFADIAAGDLPSHSHVRSNITDFWSEAFWGSIPDKPSSFTPSAHNLLSAYHGDTLAASVVRGDILVGNATPKWSRLAKGTSGKYLRSNGTDPLWATILDGDLPSSIVRTSRSISTTYPLSGGGDLSANRTLSLLLLAADLGVNGSNQLYVKDSGIDHGGIGGLGDDDHSQYYNSTRHTKAIHDALGLDHGALVGRGDDDHTLYLRVSGVRALTGNWDAGGYQIRALKFYSDQATGVAPFTVLSTTKVPNLNADLLEGYHGADISTVNTYARRNSSGDINARLFRSEYDTTNATINYIMTQIDTISNNYIRPSTPAQLIAALNLALTTRKLDDFGTPDDNTDLNATTARHGLLPKLGGGTVNFLRADGAWAAPGGGGADLQFRAYRNTTSQSVGAGATVKVQFNAENYDPDSKYDPSTNYRYSPATAGYYNITATIYTYLASGKIGILYIYKNGVEIARYRKQVGQSAYFSFTISTHFYLTSSEYIEVYYYNGDASARDIFAGSNQSWFSAYKFM